MKLTQMHFVSAFVAQAYDMIISDFCVPAHMI